MFNLPAKVFFLDLTFPPLAAAILQRSNVSLVNGIGKGL